MTWDYGYDILCLTHTQYSLAIISCRNVMIAHSPVDGKYYHLLRSFLRPRGGLHWQPCSASAVNKGRAPRCLVASLASKQTRSRNLSVSGVMRLRCGCHWHPHLRAAPLLRVGALRPPCRWVAAPAPCNPAPVVASLRGSGVALRSVAPVGCTGPPGRGPLARAALPPSHRRGALAPSLRSVARGWCVTAPAVKVKDLLRPLSRVKGPDRARGTACP